MRNPISSVLLLAGAFIQLACASQNANAPQPGSEPLTATGQSGNSASAVELVVEGGHTNNIQSLSLNREGTLLASTGSDSLVKLWDVRMGRELRTFTGHTFATSLVRFSPDDRYLASGGWDRELRLWSVDQSQENFVLLGHTGAVRDFAFTPDSKFLVSSGMQDAAVCWDLGTRMPRGVYNAPKGMADSTVSMHPNGERVLVTASRRVKNGAADDNLVAEVDAHDCHKLSERFYSENFGQALYSRDGSLIALSDGDKVAIISSENFGEVRRIEGKGNIQFRPDGKLLVGTTVYDAQTGSRIQEYAARPDTFSADGSLFAAIDTTGKWNPALGEEADFLGQNRELERSATIYAVESGAAISRVKSPGRIGWYGNAESPFALAHSPKEPVLAVGTADGAVRLWDLRRANGPRLLVRHSRVVHATEFSPQGKLLASCGGDSSFVFRVGNGEKLVSRQGSCGSIAFSPDEKFVYFGRGDGKVERVEIKSGQVTHTAEVGSGNVVMLAFGAEKLVAATEESWDYVAYTPELVEVDREVFATDDPDGVRLNDADLSGTRAVLGMGYHKLFVSMMETIPNSPLVIFDRDTGAVSCMIKDAHRGGVTRVTLNRAGSIAASGGGDGIVKLWDADTCQELASFQGDSEVWGIEFTHEQNRLAVLGADGAVRLYELSGTRQLVATLVGLGDEDFVIALPDHHFMASRGGLKGVSFRVGLRSIPFEQYDLRLNRPDKVMKALGSADASVISLLEHAHARRLKKLGFTEDMLGEDFALPTAQLTSAAPLSSTERQLSLQVTAADSRYQLDRLLVTVNDVPVHGTKGISLRGRGAKVTLPISIELGAGENLVAVSVLNERGVESLRENFAVRYLGPVKKPNLHVIAVGISKYQDVSLNLDYAAKDANDVADFWRQPLDKYGEVRITQLLNEDATRTKFERLRTALEKTAVDDQVVLFMAGHGMLDGELDYYFVTHDFVRERPSAKGLPYDAIEGLLDGIPARQKLVLIDTCHSGEVDDGAVAAALPVQSGSRSIAGVGTVKVSERKLVLTQAPGATAPAPVPGMTTSSNMRSLLGELFADLRRGSGAVVISSAGGSEAALESARWKNGVFTFSVLEGLRQRHADRNQDSQVEVSELRDYVTSRVNELTQGAQTPTARRENLHSDFVIY